jgi:hypothetical protein
MYLRRCYRKKDGKRHGYWALVESYRSSRGPRQRVVAYLGEMDAAGRLGIHQQAAGAVAVAQRGLFRDGEPQWVEVDLKRIAVERKRAFGGPWIGLELCRQVGLIDFLERTLPAGREEISRPVMAQILILARLCDPASELHIAERFYEASALKSLLKRLEPELRSKDWKQVREGLEVRLCPAPGGEEIFLLCRSAQRKEKEQAMHERFEKRIEEGLDKIVASCRKRKQLPAAVGQRLGRLLGKNSRTAGALQSRSMPMQTALRSAAGRKWIAGGSGAWLSEGCDVLGSNVTDWSPEDSGVPILQLTEAEAAFRIQKTDLQP